MPDKWMFILGGVSLVVLIVAVSFFISVIVSVLTPEAIGETAGQIVKSYNEAVAE